jgi:hypothetical protein
MSIKTETGDPSRTQVSSEAPETFQLALGVGSLHCSLESKIKTAVPRKSGNATDCLVHLGKKSG